MTRPFRLTEKQTAANRLLGQGQRHSLIVGGARSGKTFLFVRALVVRALRAPGSRHAILRFRANAARSSIALDTLPKVMNLCFPNVSLTERRQDGYFLLPNNSEIWIGGLDDKDRVEKILGQEYATLYFNECSQIPYSSVLVARTRLAQVVEGLAQRAYYDLNPAGTGHWSYHEFIEHRDPISRQPLGDPNEFCYAYINPSDNAANLSPEFLKSLQSLPEKQRRRFFDGVYVAEVDGALWTVEGLERTRADNEGYEPGDPRLGRIVIGVDPSGASSAEDKRSDEIGIVVAGMNTAGVGIVLEDGSERLGPFGWGKKVSELAKKWGADRVIAEINYGGAMVEATMRTADKSLPVKVITASRGKHVRAEPISALYEPTEQWPQGRVQHAGRFPELEDQMLNFSTAGYTGDRSPDRADAMVWALTELMLGEGTDPATWIKAFADG